MNEWNNTDVIALPVATLECGDFGRNALGVFQGSEHGKHGVAFTKLYKSKLVFVSVSYQLQQISSCCLEIILDEVPIDVSQEVHITSKLIEIDEF